MYGCESWTIKKAECWRIDAFELWCWRRLLRVPWTARRSNQSILKEISPDYSLEGLMMKFSNTLATWFEELTHLKRPWCLGRLMVGGEGDDRGWDGWMVSSTQWTWVWVNSGSLWWTGRPGMLQSMESQKAGHDWATELNWTELSLGCRLLGRWQSFNNKLESIKLIPSKYIMWNAGPDDYKPESKLLGEISKTSDMWVTPPLWQKVKRNYIASWWGQKKRMKKLA